MIKRASEEQIRKLASYIAMNKQAGISWGRLFTSPTAKKAWKWGLGIGGGLAGLGLTGTGLYYMGRSSGKGDYDTLKTNFDTANKEHDTAIKGWQDKERKWKAQGVAGTGSFWKDLFEALQALWQRIKSSFNSPSNTSTNTSSTTTPTNTTTSK